MYFFSLSWAPTGRYTEISFQLFDAEPYTSQKPSTRPDGSNRNPLTKFPTTHILLDTTSRFVVMTSLYRILGHTKSCKDGFKKESVSCLQELAGM